MSSQLGKRPTSKGLRDRKTGKVIAIFEAKIEAQKEVHPVKNSNFSLVYSITKKGEARTTNYNQIISHSMKPSKDRFYENNNALQQNVKRDNTKAATSNDETGKVEMFVPKVDFSQITVLDETSERTELVNQFAVLQRYLTGAYADKSSLAPDEKEIIDNYEALDEKNKELTFSKLQKRFFSLK